MVTQAKELTQKQWQAKAKEYSREIREATLLANAYRKKGEDENADAEEARLERLQRAAVAIVEQVEGIKPSRETREVTHTVVMEEFVPLSTRSLATSASDAAKAKRRSLVHFQNDDGLIRITRSQVYRRDGVDKDGNEMLTAMTGSEFHNVARITPYMVKAAGAGSASGETFVVTFDEDIIEDAPTDDESTEEDDDTADED